MKNIPQASTRIAYWVGADLVSARNFRGWIHPTRLIRRTGVSPVSVIPAKAGIHLDLLLCRDTMHRVYLIDSTRHAVLLH